MAKLYQYFNQKIIIDLFYLIILKAHKKLLNPTNYILEEN